MIAKSKVLALALIVIVARAKNKIFAMALIAIVARVKNKVFAVMVIDILTSKYFLEVDMNS